MSDSDSDYDLNDPFTSSMFFQSPCKKVTKGIILKADELIAKRTKFWDACKNLEVSTNAPLKAEESNAANGESIDARSAHAPVTIEIIQLTHPGIEVLATIDSQPDYKPGSLVYNMCMNLEGDVFSPFQQELNCWGERKFLYIIYSRIISKFASCTDKDLDIIGAGMLILMATTKEAPLSESCFDLLLQLRQRWTPSLGDMLNVFIFWGIPVVKLIPPANGNADKFKLFVDMPHYAPQDHNLSLVMRYFTILFEQNLLLPHFGQASLLFRAVLLVQMDVRLRNWTWTHLSQGCLSALLRQVSQDDWDNHKKFLQHCRSVYFKNEHFHNQSFICLRILDFCPRCKQVSIYLAWRLVQQLTSAEQQLKSASPPQQPAESACPPQQPAERTSPQQQPIDNVWYQTSSTLDSTDNLEQPEEMSSLLSLVDLLVKRKVVIFKQDLYHRHMLLSVVRYLVTAYRLSASDSDELQQLIDFVSEFALSVRHNVMSVDSNVMKSLFTRVVLHWKKLQTNFTSSLNDSQSQSQPTPVKIQ